jgi:hypothetical protein
LAPNFSFISSIAFTASVGIQSLFNLGFDLVPAFDGSTEPPLAILFAENASSTSFKPCKFFVAADLRI